MGLNPEQYPYLKFRVGVWREIVRYIHRDVGTVPLVVELAAGFCDFINQYPAQKKICYEINPDMKRWAGADIEMRCENALSVGGMDDASVDLVFASNFLEHLDEKDLDKLIPRIYKVLRPAGKLVLLQPNYRLCKDHYFDDPTHLTVFSDEKMGEFLGEYGFSINKIIPGFLPFSMKSRLPKWPFWVRLYLASPIKPSAAQMYVVAVKE